MSTNPATKRFQDARLHTINLRELGVDKRHVAALLEVDVTRARQSIRDANRGADSTVSFLAWMVKSISTTLAVPVSVVVERMVDDRRLAFPVAMYNAGVLSLSDIATSIQRARDQRIDSASVVCGDRRVSAWFFRRLPAFVRSRMLSRAVARTASRVQKAAAASGDAGRPHVTITPAGMGGRIKGWFIPKIINAVSIGVGAVTQKAVVVNGAICPRDVLHLAFVVDQRHIDTTVSSRWINALVRGMEAGRELSFN
jgi:hypothetical protein